MAWVRFDDGMPEDEKVARLSDVSFRAYVASICYVARALTDGRISHKVLSQIAGRRTKQVIAELTPSLLHEPGDCCTSPKCQEADLAGLPADYYLIHNYLKYNPTKAKVEADRAAAQQRMKALRS